MQVPARDQQYLRFGSFTLDLVSREIKNNGHRIHLQEKPFQVLSILLKRPGKLVTREELRQELWPADTFVDFEHSINTAIKKLRDALDDHAEEPLFIETLPKRGYRFVAQLEGTIEEDAESAPLTENIASATRPIRKGNRWYALLGVVGFAVVAMVVGPNLGSVRDRLVPKKISEQDTIVVADFSNTTGDPVFDDTLKEALSISLKQSPFLNVLPEREVAATLRRMARPADTELTHEVVRELCQRAGSKAYVAGSIAKLDSEYALGLKAVNCQSGKLMAQELTTVAAKEDVLNALSRATSSLRTKLGESLPSVQKFDVPIEVTTSSLDALKNYSTGVAVGHEQGDAPSIPFLKRAIELDSDFPMAYASLASAYVNLNQPSLGLEYATKAYQLRNRASEREKLRISAIYFYGTGEVEKEAQTYELWITDYPRDFPPYANLGAIYKDMGQYDKALPKLQEAVRLAPDNVFEWTNLGTVYFNLNRLDEAKATFDQALANKLDGGFLRRDMYSLAFLRGDTTQMEQQLNWALGKPGDEDLLLATQSDTEAYYGRLNKARDFSRRAVASAVRADSKEAAASWQVDAALREAELGNAVRARNGAKGASALSPGRNVKAATALVLAQTGDVLRAQKLAQELEKDYPSYTMLKVYWLPVINATIELGRGNPSQALGQLEATAPYELGNQEALFPAYVRGQAYLLAHNGTAAAAEFQKVLDHRSIVLNDVTGSLAHLEIGRAYAMTGNAAKARAAYQDFFTLWKDADPGIPVLKQAKVEYAKLQ